MPDSHAENRWYPLIGGTMLNLVLGTFYGWSVFVLPLEQEFGWARQQTSWTFGNYRWASFGSAALSITALLALLATQNPAESQ